MPWKDSSHKLWAWMDGHWFGLAHPKLSIAHAFLECLKVHDACRYVCTAVQRKGWKHAVSAPFSKNSQSKLLSEPQMGEFWLIRYAWLTFSPSSHMVIGTVTPRSHKSKNITKHPGAEGEREENKSCLSPAAWTPSKRCRAAHFSLPHLPSTLLHPIC